MSQHLHLLDVTPFSTAIAAIRSGYRRHNRSTELAIIRTYSLPPPARLDVPPRPDGREPGAERTFTRRALIPRVVRVARALRDAHRVRGDDLRRARAVLVDADALLSEPQRRRLARRHRLARHPPQLRGRARAGLSHALRTPSLDQVVADGLDELLVAAEHACQLYSRRAVRCGTMALP